MNEPAAAPLPADPRTRPGGPPRALRLLIAALAVLGLLAAPSAALAAAPPNPSTPGPYQVNRSYYHAGDLQLTVTSTGRTCTGASCGVTQPGTLEPGDSTAGPGNTFPQPLEGTVTWPSGDGPRGSGPYPVILFQHGRHNACVGAAGQDSGTQIWATGRCPNLVPPNPVTGFWPSWEGYEYMADLLASHGYVVISVSAGAVVTYDQNGYNPVDAGGLARAQIIANSLDLLKSWNTTPGPGGVGSNLIGKLDFSRVAIMGHSRGGEGVTQFITYNRQRPGARYNLTGAFALAPIDRNKQFPQGTNYAVLAPACDGDVSSISGWNPFERSKYANADDPFAKYGMYVEGANHNWYNTRWVSSDRTGSDAACGPSAATNVRLTAAEQRDNGLATMSTFLRVYGGGETELKPWITGEAGYPDVFCPDPATTASVDCRDLTKYSYIAPAGERQDIVRPSSTSQPTTAAPTARDDAGGSYRGDGFALFEWCNPDAFADPQSANPPATQTTTPIKACPGPPVGAASANSFNRSMGPQLALAWDGPATLSAQLRGEARDASRFRTLSFRAAYQFTDTARNPLGRGYDWTANPLSAVAGRPVQDLHVALVDRSGHESVTKLTDHSSGILSTLGANNSTSQPRHLALNGHRIPLSAFSGVDLTQLDRVELRFGGADVPATGAIQLADLAFQETAASAVTTGPATVPLTRMAGDPVLPKVDGVVTGSPLAATPTGTCVDQRRPTATVRTATLRTRVGGAVMLRGTAADAGCTATATKKARKGSVVRVQASVSRKVGTQCRYLTNGGRLTRKMRCGLPLSVIARGKTTWRLGGKATKLPKGVYTVKVQAIDRAGNLSRPTARTLRVR